MRVASVQTAVFTLVAILSVCMSPAARAKDHSEDHAQPSGQELRIAGLLSQLADDARASVDEEFAARTQSQAASLLWPYDPELARTIFRRAFEAAVYTKSLSGGLAAGEAVAKPDGRFVALEKRQLLTEVLGNIAGRDPEMAEMLARTLADSIQSSIDNIGAGSPPASVNSGGPDSGSAVATSQALQPEIEERELLIGVAIQIVDREPYRAMALAQMSLALGISPNLPRLLMLMRPVDAVLSDLLFSHAVSRLEQRQMADLDGVHALGSYLVWAVHQSGKEAIGDSVIRSFLKLSLTHLSRNAASKSYRAVAGDVTSRRQLELEAAAVYFIGRQLADLFARYMPERWTEVRGLVARLGDPGQGDSVIEVVVTRPSGPAEVAREAREAMDDEDRDRLYARAAMGWLATDAVVEAHGAATRILDAETRDRVLAQIARRQTSQGQIDDALGIARSIADNKARVEVLVRLAMAALSRSDRARAGELLNHAESEALKIDDPMARSQALLTIVAVFADFDTVRGFEVMQTAVRSVNQLQAAAEPANRASSEEPTPNAGQTSSSSPVEKIRQLDFDATFAVLARSDFDRALLLAQQLECVEASMIAQLAVCRGGLGSISGAAKPAKDEASAANQ